MSNQRPLFIDQPENRRRIYRLSKRRKRLPVVQPQLIADDAFTPVQGVPRTRGECPSTRSAPCPHVRCRHHLWLVDADARAGRPGLSAVPRDERGLTLSTPGHAGDTRAGTTLRPAWLTVRGLQVEREVKVYVSATLELVEMRNGTLDVWLSRLHEGEPVEVYDTYSVMDEPPLLVAMAELTPDGLRFDRELPEYVVNGTSGLRLVRVRPIDSCALDVAARGPRSNEQIGDAMGKHRTLAARLVPRAVGHAIELGEEEGIERADLMRALMKMGNDRL